MKFVPVGDFSIDQIVSIEMRLKRTKDLAEERSDIGLNLAKLVSQNTNSYHVELFYQSDLAGLNLQIEEEVKAKPSGLWLFSSPHGQGKTTTAYRVLEKFWSERVGSNRIVTVERKPTYPRSDPYYDSGIQRLVARPQDSNYDVVFESVRRSRPDVLFFDDVADKRTAQEVMDYVRGGHLVFAAVAAKDAESSVHYFSELVDGKNVNLSGVISQRLVTAIHGECKGEGCAYCADGYKGRTPAYQIIGPEYINGAYREAMAKGKSLNIGPTMASVLNQLVDDKLASPADVEMQKKL